jgi:ATP-binding cassette subfamily B protein
VDRILVFRDGAVVEQGTYKELAAARGSLFHRLHAEQVAGLSGVGG